MAKWQPHVALQLARDNIPIWYNTCDEKHGALHHRRHLRGSIALLLGYDILEDGNRRDAKRIHMKTEWLERILATARECGVPCIGFNEF